VRLDLVVGPNGAGKTTFARLVLLCSLPPGTAFVNADEIALQRWPDDPEARSYDAARIAATTRDALIGARRPFVAETVFSHPSKLEFMTSAREAGFVVALHVLLVPEALTVSRVEHRVTAGGHSVPEDKIRQRYQRLWPLVAQAMSASDRATAYDNSGTKGPRIVAQLVEGVAVGQVTWPAWSPLEVTSRWPRT
jgi:predicted ABC-type ATPase